jgi:hypothetical protein
VTGLIPGASGQSVEESVWQREDDRTLARQVITDRPRLVIKTSFGRLTGFDQTLQGITSGHSLMRQVFGRALRART